MSLKELALVQSGERTNDQGKPISNRILLAIPEGEFRSIRIHLESVSLRRHYLLHEPHEKQEYIYFPNDGLLSIVVVTQNGRTVEAGIVGKEGIVGLAAVVGLNRNPLREVVQIAGDGFKIAVDVLRNALKYAPQLQTLLSRYAVLHGLQVSQTAACNRLHDSEQRLARWLLMTQDRVDSGLLSITHDFLATMLGTDRPTITLAAGRLQKKRLIEYSRGSVRILNRKKLELVVCECYGIVQQFNGPLGLK
jgi:CRP-like cAMP-binding protein